MGLFSAIRNWRRTDPPPQEAVSHSVAQKWDTLDFEKLREHSGGWSEMDFQLAEPLPENITKQPTAWRGCGRILGILALAWLVAVIGGACIRIFDVDLIHMVRLAIVGPGGLAAVLYLAWALDGFAGFSLRWLLSHPHIERLSRVILRLAWEGRWRRDFVTDANQKYPSELTIRDPNSTPEENARASRENVDRRLEISRPLRFYAPSLLALVVLAWLPFLYALELVPEFVLVVAALVLFATSATAAATVGQLYRYFVRAKPLHSLAAYPGTFDRHETNIRARDKNAQPIHFRFALAAAFAFAFFALLPPVEVVREIDTGYRIGAPYDSATLLLAGFLAAAYVWACVRFALGPILRLAPAIATKDVGDNTDADALPPSLVLNYSDRLHRSPNDVEHGSLFLGRHAFGHYPVLLPVRALYEHAHILGGAGSGKTSLAVLPIALQLMQRRIGPVFIVDGKGDPALFHAARATAAHYDVPFKWFTLTAHQSSYGFNVLDHLYALGLTPDSTADILLEALGLEHGAGYGRGYFSAQSRHALREALTLRRHSSAATLQKAAEKQASSIKNAEALGTTLGQIAASDALNVSPETNPQAYAEAIRLDETAANRGVVYFNLPRSQGAVLARQVASLVLQTATATYAAATHRGDPLPHGFLVVDEFQMILSENTPGILEQARSSGLHLIAAHQSLEQLHPNREVDLRDAMEENTRVKIVFAARSSAARDRLIDRSGESLYVDASVSQPDLETGSMFEERIPATFTDSFRSGNRFEKNDIITFTNWPNLSLLECNPDEGMLQWQGLPNAVEHWHAFSHADYERFSQLDWPSPRSGTVQARTLAELLDENSTTASDAQARMRAAAEGDPAPATPASSSHIKFGPPDAEPPPRTEPVEAPPAPPEPAEPAPAKPDPEAQRRRRMTELENELQAVWDSTNPEDKKRELPLVTELSRLWSGPEDRARYDRLIDAVNEKHRRADAQAAAEPQTPEPDPPMRNGRPFTIDEDTRQREAARLEKELRTLLLSPIEPPPGADLRLQSELDQFLTDEEGAERIQRIHDETSAEVKRRDPYRSIRWSLETRFRRHGHDSTPSELEEHAQYRRLTIDHAPSPPEGVHLQNHLHRFHFAGRVLEHFEDAAEREAREKLEAERWEQKKRNLERTAEHELAELRPFFSLDPVDPWPEPDNQNKKPARKKTAKKKTTARKTQPPAKPPPDDDIPEV